MPWYIASLLSNICIIFVEYWNRSTPGGFTAALPATLVPIVLAQWGLYLAFNGAPHWLSAWLVFTVGNSLMRIAAVSMFATGEVTSWPYVVAGIAGITGSAYVLKQGLL